MASLRAFCCFVTLVVADVMSFGQGDMPFGSGRISLGSGGMMLTFGGKDGVMRKFEGLYSNSSWRGIGASGGLAGGRTPLSPDPRESILHVCIVLLFVLNRRAFPAFLHEGNEVLFLLGRDLVPRDVAEGTGARIETVSLDVPTCAHFGVLVEVGTFLGTL